jgi:hypothetical protein
MEASGQFHTQATIPQRKDPQVPLKSRLYGPQSQSEYTGEEANLLPVVGWSQFKAIKVYVAA